MPLYSYTCCGNTAEAFNRVDERRTHAPKCSTCKKPMDIRLAPTYGFMAPDYHYKCPMSGEVVTSAARRRYLMAKHNVVDANDLKPGQAIRRAEQEKAAREADAKKLHPFTEKELEPYRPELASTR